MTTNLPPALLAERQHLSGVVAEVFKLLNSDVRVQLKHMEKLARLGALDHDRSLAYIETSLNQKPDLYRPSLDFLKAHREHQALDLATPQAMGATRLPGRL